ncbi:hypothetical protein VNO80_25666 [Phaseolus coccineus]|uniref:Uncharacterized protein n=1 Tax=Phaseolus coccineus TaxID=3886 RepID=A0AAN9QM38_PHACN
MFVSSIQSSSTCHLHMIFGIIGINANAEQQRLSQSRKLAAMVEPSTSLQAAQSPSQAAQPTTFTSGTTNHFSQRKNQTAAQIRTCDHRGRM